MIKKNLKAFVLSVLLILQTIPALPQRTSPAIYGTNDENASCGVLISSYRTFFRANRYADALPTWLRAFNQCRDSSERIYVDGASMYRSFIEATPPGPLREARIDTLMLIYDLRLEHFGGEGNVLGRKGKDILNYRGSDIKQVQQANSMLRRSIEIQGQESQEAILQLCISSDMFLYRKRLLDENLIIADYVMIVGNLDQLEKKNSRWLRTRQRIEELMFKEDLLSCKALNNYFEPLMEQNKSDTAFLQTLVSSYRPLNCEGSSLIAAASEYLYRLRPGPESAHSLAMQFIARDDLQKADFYLKEALQGANIQTNTRAQWYYELAVVSYGLGDYCQAIGYARESIKLKDRFGQAYILLGDAIISSRKSLGDDFQKRAAYWAAADKYETASLVDPSVSEEARKKLSRSVAHFPDREDIFFSDISEGQAYLVEGCINDTTTVRARK